jgi:GntR family transcriptional regulator, trigonelline degradation regulator
MIARLKETVVVLRAAYASRDVEKILVAKQEFYDVLLDGSENPLVRSILRTLNDRINILRRISLSSPDRGNCSLTEIDLIIAAIELRDEDAAHAASLHHIENACESALSKFV